MFRRHAPWAALLPVAVHPAGEEGGRWARVLALAAAAVVVAACGDDGPGSGTGGGGGSGGATSAATTTAASGGGGGAGGEGGGGGDGGADLCAMLDPDGPALRVVVVDENGAGVAVSRVAWQPHPADPFWLEPKEAECDGGDGPPCVTWRIDGELPDRIVVSSERATSADEEGCIAYASAFVQVHFPEGEETAPQLVHLTLPSDGRYCIDEGGASSVDHDHDEEVDEADCLIAPEPKEGPLVLGVVDQDGAPVPATIAHWYYPPEGPDHDGEHPLVCVDVRCETWVLADVPAAGTIYVSATYAGPLNPFVQTGWSGFEGTPIEVELDERGEIVPMSVELVLDTTTEGAIGG